jgi:DNA polymerase
MEDRLARLELLQQEASGCTRCRLSEGRTQVVFGVGNPDAELMFVGEAPGFHEDKQGYPFVGQAGKLLDKLLAGIGLTRADVYIANVLKCRPPGNRDPQPDEIEQCEGYLFRQIEAIEPKLVATLGNFATKLLSGKQLGITRVHGQEQEVTLGGRQVTLYPLYHPAAALYTPRMLQVLEEDFRRIPALISRILLADEAEPEPVIAREHPELAMAAPVTAEPAVQLGLF